MSLSFHCVMWPLSTRVCPSNSFSHSYRQDEKHMNGSKKKKKLNRCITRIEHTQAFCKILRSVTYITLFFFPTSCLCVCVFCLSFVVVVFLSLLLSTFLCFCFVLFLWVNIWVPSAERTRISFRGICRTFLCPFPVRDRIPCTRRTVPGR